METQLLSGRNLGNGLIFILKATDSQSSSEEVSLTCHRHRRFRFLQLSCAVSTSKGSLHTPCRKTALLRSIPGEILLHCLQEILVCSAAWTCSQPRHAVQTYCMRIPSCNSVSTSPRTSVRRCSGFVRLNRRVSLVSWFFVHFICLAKCFTTFNDFYSL